MNNNDELANLQRAIYDARNSNGVEAARIYAEAMVSRLKDTLCTCATEDVSAVQGEIKAYRDIIASATKPPFDLNE